MLAIAGFSGALPGGSGRAQQAPAPTRAADDAGSAPMLAVVGLPADPALIRWEELPRVPAEHVVVSDARAVGGVSQHAFLSRYTGQYWLMWSDGPGIEDRAGQRVKFAVSEDGLAWSEPAWLTPEPPISSPDSPHYNSRSAQGFRWIARGFWPRRGELLALATLDEAAGLYGPSLQLRAFRLDPKTDEWHDAGIACERVVNHFPPQQLADRGWLMAGRSYQPGAGGAGLFVAGEESLGDWERVPLPERGEQVLEDWWWWALGDGRLVAMARDTRGGGQLVRCFSEDQGRSWSRLERTNFPAVTSRVHGTRLGAGRYILVFQAEAAADGSLALAVSGDGVVFDRLLRLAGARPVDSPFVLEDQDRILIAVSGGKQSVEILRVRLADLDPP